MSTTVTDPESTGDVVIWPNEVLAEAAGLPFSHAKTETCTSAAAKRRDVPRSPVEA